MSKWQEYRLDEIGDIIGGGTPSSKIDTYWNGDIGWITYDFFIYNISHMVLSLVIIIINIYGIWNLCKTNKV